MHSISGDGTKIETPHTDPDYAPTVEVFDHLGYDEIYRGVMKLEPEVLTAGRQAWQGSGGGMAEAVQQANTEIRAAMADGWRGSAAQLASGAMQAFEALGQNLSDVMSEVGRRLGQANDAAETLRASVSHPVSVSPDLEGALLDPKRATVNAEMQKTAENVRLDVVRVMNSVYAGAFIPTGNNVPGFPVGGMYPNPAPAVPNPGTAVPGGAAVDVVTPGTVHAPSAQPAVTQPDSDRRPPDRAQPAQPAGATRTDAAVPVAPAAVTAPAAASVPAAPAVVHAAAAPTSAVDIVAPQDGRPAPAAPASAAPPAVPAVATRASGASITPQNSEADRKRADKSRQDEGASGGDAASGMGAGVVGGLAGSAFAFGDTTRPAASVPLPPRRSPAEDEDEDYYYPDIDEPTFLEPAEPETELVGHLNPTTPPVVGEWADDEE